MTFHCTYSPGTEETEAINAFLSQQKSFSFEQLPAWTITDSNTSRTCFCYAKVENVIVAYVKVNEKPLGMANITFGPLAPDTETMCRFLEQLFTFYKKKQFASLTIQPDFFYDQFSVSANLAGHTFIFKPNLLNWATLRLNLEHSLEDIITGFSSHHKKELKRGIKAGLTARKIDSTEEVKLLSSIYTKMYKERKLATDEGFNRLKFEKIFHFINDNKTGFILGVYTPGGILISGIIVMYQGTTAFYYIGASDPDFKKLPINYSGMQKALEFAKEDGLHIFDFGGYKVDAEESDQVYHINWFKKGFGGNLVIYPKTVIVPLNKFFYTILNVLLFTRNQLKKIIYKG